MKYEWIDGEPKFIAALGEDGRIEGIAVPFDKPDSFGRVIARGAVKNLRATLPMLKEHEELIGYIDDMEERASGLFVRGRVNLEVAAGREYLALARQGLDAGLPMGMSIGWNADPRDIEGDGNVTIFRKITLVEISLVALPAFAGAGVRNVAHLKRLERIFGILEGAKRRLGIKVGGTNEPR